MVFSFFCAGASFCSKHFLLLGGFSKNLFNSFYFLFKWYLLFYFRRWFQEGRACRERQGNIRWFNFALLAHFCFQGEADEEEEEKEEEEDVEDDDDFEVDGEFKSFPFLMLF